MKRLLWVAFWIAIAWQGIGFGLRYQNPSDAILSESLTAARDPLEAARGTASVPDLAPNAPTPSVPPDAISQPPDASSAPPPELEARLLAALPAKLRARGKVITEPSGLGIWSLSLAVDGVPIERTDVRAERDAAGDWILLQEPSFGELPDAPAVFPSAAPGDIENLVLPLLEKESASLKSARPAGKLWLVGAGELVPCHRIEVEWVKDSDRLTRQEIWCVHASTNEVIWRRSIRRR